MIEITISYHGTEVNLPTRKPVHEILDELTQKYNEVTSVFRSISTIHVVNNYCVGEHNHLERIMPICIEARNHFIQVGYNTIIPCRTSLVKARTSRYRKKRLAVIEL